MRVKLVRLDLLKHIEAWSPKRVENMTRKIRQAGVLERAICIESEHFLILDGQHRYEVIKGLGLKYIPCDFYSYADDSLLVWSLRQDYEVSKALVVRRALSGDIYPYKTAKHRFPGKRVKIMFPLDRLEACSRRCRKEVLEIEFSAGEG